MKSITSLGFGIRLQRGFTLVEILVAVAIVAILAAIALPAYSSYITKSEMRSAQADLLALSLNFENRYQRTLVYPVLDAADRNDLDEIKKVFKGWSPSSIKNFSFKIETNTTSEYKITAEGNTGTRQENCKISLTESNERESTGCQYAASGTWL